MEIIETTNGNIFKNGDVVTINNGNLEFKIEYFTNFGANIMAGSEYGEFNVEILEHKK